MKSHMVLFETGGLEDCFIVKENKMREVDWFSAMKSFLKSAHYPKFLQPSAKSYMFLYSLALHHPYSVYIFQAAFG